MLWNKDKRRPLGGFWYCAERRRRYNATRHLERLAWVQEREAIDFIYRATNALRHRRREALKRKALRHLPRED